MWMTEGFHRPTCLEPQGLVPGRQSPPGTSPVSKRSSVAWGHVSSGAQRGGQPPRGGAGGSRRASVLAATGRRIGALEGLDSGDNECCSATTNVAGIRRSPVGGPTPARAPAFVSRTHIHAWRARFSSLRPGGRSRPRTIWPGTHGAARPTRWPTSRERRPPQPPATTLPRRRSSTDPRSPGLGAHLLRRGLGGAGPDNADDAVGWTAAPRRDPILRACGRDQPSGPMTDEFFASRRSYESDC